MLFADQQSSLLLGEMREFASFTTAEQRYIRCSLEVAEGRSDVKDHWARGLGEAATIERQAQVYGDLDFIRSLIPQGIEAEDAAALLAPLMKISAFDLQHGKLTSFAAYRFLYERLIGGGVRPWLPGAFCAASALPHLHPERRRTLLQSISEAAATAPGWSSRQPCFYPEWVDKIEEPLAN